MFSDGDERADEEQIQRIVSGPKSISSKTCLFTNALLEEEYVKFMVKSWGWRMMVFCEASIKCWSAFTIFYVILFVFRKDSMLLFSAGLNLFLFVKAYIARLILRSEWAIVSNRTEAIATVYMAISGVWIGFMTSADTYGFEHRTCLPGQESDCDAGHAYDMWIRFSLIFGSYPLMLMTLASSVEVVRLRAAKIMVTFIIASHALRSVFLTPVPMRTMPFWMAVSYIMIPWLFITVHRSREISKRELFLLHRELRKHNSELLHKLGEAERALTFEAPTAKEKAAVAAALGDPLQVSELSSAAMVQVRFEQLTFHERIGAGGFGEVIRGDYGGAPVAIKRLLRNRIDEAHIAMFREEMLMVCRLHHPNIVQFVGVSWDNVANICIVFELIERGSLGSVLRDAKLRLTWEDPKLKIAIDASCGLVYLHSRSPPIIHRDMKPDNMLLTSTFTCKLTDFGAARVFDDEATMTKIGTPHYIAPEVIQGEYYNEKADVYGFGMVLLEMHTHEPPYQKHFAANQIQANVVRGRRPPLPDDLPVSLRTLISECWSQDPADRPSASQVFLTLKQQQDEMQLIMGNGRGGGGASDLAAAAAPDDIVVPFVAPSPPT